MYKILQFLKIGIISEVNENSLCFAKNSLRVFLYREKTENHADSTETDFRKM